MKPHKTTQDSTTFVTPPAGMLRSGEIALLLEVEPKAASRWLGAGCPTDDALALLNWLGRNDRTAEKVMYRVAEIREEFSRHAGDGTDGTVLNLVFLARMLSADIDRLNVIFLDLYQRAEERKAAGADATGVDRQRSVVFRENNAKRSALRRTLDRMGRVAQAAGQAVPSE